MNMPATMPPSAPQPHHTKLEELRPVMAKVLMKVEAPWRERIGVALVRAFALASLSHKEVAAHVDRDQAQIARWCAGTERPAFDVLFSVPELRGPLVIALAELSEEIGIATTITVRRRA